MTTDQITTIMPDPLDIIPTDKTSSLPETISTTKKSGKTKNGKPKRKSLVLSPKSCTKNLSTKITDTTKKIDILPATIDTTALDNALSKRGETLDKLISTILPKLESPARDRMVKFLEMSSDGKTWREIESEICMNWREISQYFGCKIWAELVHIAQEQGETYRRLIRESVAHTRAVFGHDRAVYQQGVLVGHVTEVDNRLLEFLLKADNPQKYRDSAASVNVHNQVGVVVEWDFSPDPVKTIPSQEVKK